MRLCAVVDPDAAAAAVSVARMAAPASAARMCVRAM
jgi:hypothetical protein